MNWDIIGHAWAVRLLQKHMHHHQVRHAYLFSGPDAIGKRTLALRFAQALNCTAPPQPGMVCGECRACRLIQDQAHPDLHIVEAEHKGGILKVEWIRNLQRQLALTPYEGHWRIALLPRFHEANDSAANALLKTLEEPSKHVVILMTARTLGNLLPTIVSRCEVLPLRIMSQGELQTALQERGEAVEHAALLAAVSAGRPGQALAFSRDPDLMNRRLKLIDDLLHLLEGNRSDRFDYVGRLTRGRDASAHRKRAEEVLLTWMSIWRDVLLLSSGAEAGTFNPDRKDDLSRLAETLDVDATYAYLRVTRETLRAVRQFGNVRLALETLMIDLPSLP